MLPVWTLTSNHLITRCPWTRSPRSSVDTIAILSPNPQGFLPLVENGGSEPIEEIRGIFLQVYLLQYFLYQMPPICFSPKTAWKMLIGYIIIQVFFSFWLFFGDPSHIFTCSNRCTTCQGFPKWSLFQELQDFTPTLRFSARTLGGFVGCSDPTTKNNLSLVGGFNPFEKYESKWESSPSRGENKKCFKPAPRSVLI